VHSLPEGGYPDHCLSLGGEEELVPKAVERGGYLPIPRRDTRAGEWVTGDTSVEPIRATAARATRGSESLSVIVVRGQ